MRRGPRPERFPVPRHGVAREGALDDLGAAIGIVQLQDGRLRVGIGRTQALRMRGVSFDLDRTAVVARHEQAEGGAAQLERGRVAERAAGHVPLRKVGEWDDGLRRPAAAGGHPGQRDRRPHQPEEIPPGRREHLVGVVRELASDELAKRRLAGKVVEAAPEGASGRPRV